MKLLFSLCGFLLYHSAKCANYQISLQNDNIIPCDESPNNFVDKMFDISTVTLTYGKNDEIFIKGTIKYIGNTTVVRNILLNVQVFRKQRGEWKSTVYNFYRQDVCSAVWNPVELWYKFTVKIPHEMRICPPKPGTTYEIDFEADLTIKNVPDRNGAGDYKAQATLIYGSMPDDFLCFVVLCDIEQI